MIQVLVKVHNNTRHHARVHFYDEKRGRALCALWPEPSYDWEVQDADVEKFSQVENACWKCRQLLTPKPLAPTRQLARLSRGKLRLVEHEAEMEKLKRWQGG